MCEFANVDSCEGMRVVMARLLGKSTEAGAGAVPLRS